MRKYGFGFDRPTRACRNFLVRLDLRYPLPEVAVAEIFERLRPIDLLVRPELRGRRFDSRLSVRPLVEDVDGLLAPVVEVLLPEVLVGLGLLAVAARRKSGQETSVEISAGLSRFVIELTKALELILLVMLLRLVSMLLGLLRLLLRMMLRDLVAVELNRQAVSNGLNVGLLEGLNLVLRVGLGLGLRWWLGLRLIGSFLL